MDWYRTFIIGGGESAKGFDFESLRGRGVLLGVNEAAFHVKCDAFFTLDRSWAINDQRKIHALPIEKHLCRVVGELWPVFSWATFWDRVYGPPSSVPGQLSSVAKGSGCSGLTAINLAKQKTARKIYLFGFDMVEGDYRFWYKDEMQRIKYGIADVLDAFRFVALYYEELGIEIFNVNLDSAIDAFPLIGREQVEARL